MSNNRSSKTKHKLIIGYDGDCPFCASYIRMQRLKDLDFDVTLTNFRKDKTLSKTLKDNNMDPNNGMYVRLNDKEYYADEAMTVLSSLSTSQNIINLFFKWWFKNKKRGKILYPVLRIGRNIALKILGHKQIETQ